MRVRREMSNMFGRAEIVEIAVFVHSESIGFEEKDADYYVEQKKLMLVP